MKAASILLVCTGLLLLVSATAGSKQKEPPAGPPLMFPVQYRQWVYLSSGLNMQYQGETLPSCKEGKCPPLFENVFVPVEAYDKFVQDGVWPTGTVMVMERRCSAQNVSIDTSGSTQEKLFLVAASQKTAENGWNYYLFGATNALTCQGPDPIFAGQDKLPVSNSTHPKACWQCHHDHGETDNTFIQFYPTLKPSQPARH